MNISVSNKADGSNSKSVKEMLRAGTSPEELLSQLQEEINGAQEELEAEAALKHNYTEEDIEELRSILVDDAIEYLDAIGVLSYIPDFDNDSEEDYELLYEVMYEALEKSEPQMQMYMSLIAPWLKIAASADKTDKHCDGKDCKCGHHKTTTNATDHFTKQMDSMSDAVTRLKDIMNKYNL